MADLILPGAAYTEQDGYFTNLEGKLQKAYKASYPPGEAKEDWLIINDLSSAIDGNILSTDASAVGSYDLGIFSSNDGSNKTLKKIEDGDVEVIFLLGQDNLKIKKSNEFIIYIGSHGDKGADVADLILPGAAYTEQDGYFTNLEGKLQKAYKLSLIHI